MINKFMALGVGLLMSANLMAQSAQDVKQTYADLSVFEDALALKLKKGIKKKQIDQMADTALRSVALSIFADKYNKDYRYATYSALLNPSTLGHQLSIGDGYSKYENMTGVYLPKGKHIVIVDGIATGKEVNLVVPNWLRKAPNPQEPTKDPKGWGLEKQEFRLHNGVNIIQLNDYGSLAYIDYFSDEPEKENPITVHFPTGQVNGYFDLKTQGNKEWDSLIDHAVFPIMDAKGEHIQTAYPIEAMKKYAYGKGVELIRNYDSLLFRQHRLMGLEKYKKVPKNRILARVNYNYYMFRDGDGVAYMGDKVGYAMRMVVDPASVIKGDPCWGFSHEVGHVHQTRPMFNWGGLGEVSNNLFSLYVTRSFGNKTRVSEQNNFEKAKASIIEKRISYLSDPDVFNRLIPFWQLQLYFEGIGKRPDFYADLFEAFRQQNKSKPSRRGRSDWSSDRMMGERNPAVHQLNFVKTACEVAKIDLTDFFDKYGFFYVGTLEYDDYGKYTYTMTQEMVDECKKAIKNMNLPQPEVDLTTLRDN
ncbi:MAG: hypothetical protein K0R59_2130 [Sphingobacterium sp.]|jgi:hypothetical protein|nr:hypothetical protein [Sphingobacterium sp.]